MSNLVVNQVYVVSCLESSRDQESQEWVEIYEGYYLYSKDGRDYFRGYQSNFNLSFNSSESSYRSLI
jgi:hypothetical protein